MSKKAFNILMLIFLSPLFMYAQEVDIERLEEIKEKAKDGDPRSMFLMGIVLEQGKYEKQNIKKAAQYYKQSAEAGYDSAYYNLGKMYELGLGVSQSYKVAYAYYEKLVPKNHGEAIYRFGILHEYGTGVDVDKKKAVSLYLKSYLLGYRPAQTKIDLLPTDSLANPKDIYYVHYKADKGDMLSQFVTGRMYEEGAGFSKDPAKAFNYYLKASEQGYPPAYTAIGDMYAKGKHVKKNMRLAAKNYLTATNMGDETARQRLSTIDLDNSIDPNSIEYLEYISTLDSEKAGNAVELYKLYNKFWNGEGVNVDRQRAIEYLQKAAEQDYSPAYMKLGHLYYYGNAVQQDYATAFSYFKEAFILKNDSALFIIGDMYANGLGVEVNEAKAVKYYLTAGVNGVDLAILRLNNYNVLKYVSPNDLRYVKYKGLRGDIKSQLAAAKYHLGKNEGEAVRWLRQAAEKGDSEAQVLLGKVFYLGKCNMPKDNDEAQKWFTLAAQQKNLDAFRFLADMYSKNLITTPTGGGDKDPGEQLEYAFRMASEYLNMKKGKLEAEDAVMYKIMGEIYYKREDYSNAIIRMTEFISLYSEGLHSPMDLVQALEIRASSYRMMKNYDNAIKDFENALFQLERNQEKEEIKYDYRYIKGFLIVNKAKTYFDQGNLFKACNTVLEAQRLGVQVEEKYIDICEKS